MTFSVRALVVLLVIAPIMLAGCSGGGGGGFSGSNSSSSNTNTSTGGSNTNSASTTMQVDSVVVDQGPVSGGTRFKLLGKGFQAGARVMVGGVEATDVVVSADGTQIEATAPPSSSVRIADIVVMPPGGGAPAAAPVPFHYNPPPAITTISPVRGPTSGGTQLTIFGRDFGGVVSATVGGAPATAVVASPDGTRVVLTTPARTVAGFADVVVTSSSNGAATAANAFTYFATTPAFPPSVSSVIPNNGPLAGGTQLQIQGQNFRGLVRVAVGGAGSSNVFVNTSGTLITCNTPSAVGAGARDVTVTNEDGTVATAPAAFTYNDPLAITAVTPGTGPTSGGTLITIDGTGFLGDLTVRVGGQPCASVSVNGPRTRITCLTPAVGLGAVMNVDVISSLNGSATRTNAFTYVDPPLAAVSVSPNNGPLAGGTTLTIDGFNFLPPLTVVVGATAATNVTVDQFRRRITCVTPASGVAGARNVTVSSPVNGASTLVNAFTYNAVPTITTVTPASGPLAGGTLVDVDGASFFGTVTATIGGVAVGNLTVNSTNSRVTFTTPASVSGTGAKPLVITATASGVANGSFTYNALPSIGSVSPASGPLEGSTPVTITGTNFLGTANVTIGGQPAQVTASTPTQINALTPPSTTLGSTSVEVSASLAGRILGAGLFTYDPNPPPTVTLVSPSNGPVDATTRITVTGTNFKGNLTVTVDGVTLPVLALNTERTELQVDVPPSTSGDGGKTLVIVSDTHGSVTVGGGFTYNPAPTFGGISPGDGPQTGGNLVTITGTNFGGTVRVRFGQFSAPDVVVTGGTQITCRSPGATGSGPVDVEISSSTNGTFVQPGGYFFNNFPVISSVTPESGPLVGGTPVTVAGLDFGGTVNVTLDGLACSNVAVNGTFDEVTFRTPMSASGTGPKTLLIDSSTNGAVTGTFTYNPTPTIGGIVPNNGPAQGGTTVTVTGTGFLGTVNVTIGSTPADNLVLENAEGTQLVFETRPGPAGTFDVVLGSDLTGQVTATAAFTYNPTPTITSVAPALGPVAGGTPLVIQGTDFAGDVQVFVGAVPALNVTVNGTRTRIDCVTDAGPAGTFDVTVFSDTHGVVVRPAAFTYFPPQPIVTAIEPNQAPLGTTIPITITGASFLGTVNVTIGVALATAVVADPSGTSLTCLAPSSLISGAVNVEVGSSTNGSVVVASGFRYNAAPMIASIAPDEGPINGGNTIAINAIAGRGFFGNVTVAVDGVAATNVAVNGTGEQITCTVPASTTGTGPRDVAVTASASGNVTSSGGYVYQPQASIAGVLPDRGPQSGGTAIEIFGSNFNATTNVTLDGITCTNVVVTSATTITCDTPPALNGPGAKTVELASLIHGYASRAGAFTYNALPTISNVTPTSGPRDGTNAVTVTGTGFAGALDATIGGLPITGFTVNAAGTQIVGTVPASATVGFKDVFVDNALNTGTVTLANGYRYNEPPTISSIAPDEGGEAGGNTCIIFGAFFGGNVQVFFGANPATITSINAGKTQITCRVPASTTGPVSVDVTVISDSNGTVTALNAYTYNPLPTVTSVTPNNGPAAGGTSLTITGTNFFGSVLVRIGSDLALAPAASGGTTITCITPPSSTGPGLRNITVESSTNGSAILANSYTYNAPPIAFPPVIPNNGPLAGGTLITIDGQRFAGTVTVTIDNRLCTGVVVSPGDDQIICTTPAASTGAGFKNVTINSSVNGPVTLPFAFRYNELPQVTSIVPNEGPVAEVTPITITGRFFGMDLTVAVDGQLCTNVSVTADLRTITCDVPPSVPANDTGAKDVVITSDRNGVLVVPGGFTYHPLPTINFINPNNGPLAGGQRIEIDGTGYRPTTTVRIDGNVCTNQTINATFTRITCDTPASTSFTGAKDVFIRSSATGGVTATAGYTYNPTPTVTLINPDQGPVAGGNTVQINGNGFAGTVNVTFGGNPSQSVTGSVTQINVQVPASTTGANPVDVIITSSLFGTSVFPQAYNYRGPPDVTNVNPTSGPQDGGQLVTLTGTNLFGVSQVLVGGNPATNVTNTVAGDQITLRTPSRPSGGLVDIEVTVAGGTFNVTSAYIYNPKPTITSVVPDNGPLGGGISVEINGTDLGNTSNVTIGANAAAIATTSATRTTVTLPASTSGVGPVNVALFSSTHGSASLTGGFTYNPTPTITSIVPNQAPLGGGNQAVINGTQFKGAVTASIDGRNATVLTVNPAFTQATIVVPAGASTGTKNVSLTASLAGTVTVNNTFTYFPGPTITSIVPPDGPVAGGTVIQITGTDFVGTTSVFINGVATTNTTVNAANTIITATTPASIDGAGARDLTVNATLSGSVTSTAASGGGFTYNGAPAVVSIVPNNGPLGGTNRITITGTDFDGTVTVTIGGNPATNVTVNTSGTQIGLDVPASTNGPGARNVVIDASGAGSVTVTGGYIYNLPPTIDQVIPNEGPNQGGQTAVITGTDFDGSLIVLFGGNPATVVGVSPDSQRITVTTPAFAGTGSVDVAVGSTGNGTVTATGAYTYNAPPTLTSIGPDGGPLAGGTFLTLLGTNFRGAVRVLVDGVDCTNVQVTANATITCVTPAAVSGAGEKTLRVESSLNGFVQQDPPNGFRYNPLPVVATINPDNGPASGGQAVTIGGLNFGPTVNVTIDGAAATNVSVTGTTTISLLTPSARTGIGTKDVIISSTENGVLTVTNGYTFNATPAASGPINPNNGPVAGGTPITITGTGFVAPVTVNVGGAQATGVVVTSTTTVTAVTPSRPSPGTVDVTVTSSFTGDTVIPAGFTYNTTPTVTTISPNSGPQTGNQMVQIDGANFSGNVTVTFGGNALTGISVTGGNTRITGITPVSGVTGPVLVRVESSTHGITDVPDGYTYNGAPAITSVVPDNGPVNAATNITINGSGFQDNLSVTIGGQACTGVTKNSSGTAITCSAQPLSPAGAYDVVVTSTVAGVVTLARGFTYTPTFGNSQQQSTGNAPTGIAVADFNGDGKPDFATSNQNDDTVTVMISNVTIGSFAVSNIGSFTVSNPGAGYVADEPSGIAVADFNLDGKLDVVTSNRLTQNASILLNVMTFPTSNATFSQPVGVTFTGTSVAVAAADFNGDGKADLAVADDSSGRVYVRCNATAPFGSPTFGGELQLTGLSGPVGLATADLDGDGDVDLAVAQRDANTVTVFLNNTTPGSPTASFPTTFNVGTGAGPQGITIGDLNADGLPDLVSSNVAGASITPILNSTVVGGAFGLTAFGAVAMGTGTVAVTLGDLDGAGVPDIITANSSDNTISARLNQTPFGATGAITLAGRNDRPVGQAPSGVVVTDVDFDGRKDIITSNRTSNTVSVLFNATPQGFSPANFATAINQALGVSPTAVAYADFNGDGRKDLVFAHSAAVRAFANTTTVGTTSSFSFVAQDSSAVSNATAVAVGHLNGDGRPDLVVTASGTNQAHVFLNTTLPGVNTLTFTDVSTFATGSNPQGVCIADFDGDGRQDFAVANAGANNISVYRADPANDLASVAAFNAFGPSTFTVSSNPRAIAAADFNGDGFPDLAVVNRSSSTVSIFENDGTGSIAFTAVTAVAVGLGPQAVKLIDVSNDGRPDVITANNSGSSISVAGNTTLAGGAPTFLGAVNTASPTSPTGVDAADMSGDGEPDIATSNNGANNGSVYLNAGLGSFPVGDRRDFAANTTPSAVAVVDLNNDYKPDVAVANGGANSVSLLRNQTTP